MNKQSKQQAADRPWLPTDPKQILLAIVLVLAVGGAVAFVMRYQASQPKPLPKSVYENMYKSMYGRQQGQAGGAQQGAPPAAPPRAPGNPR